MFRPAWNYAVGTDWPPDDSFGRMKDVAQHQHFRDLWESWYLFMDILGAFWICIVFIICHLLKLWMKCGKRKLWMCISDRTCPSTHTSWWPIQLQAGNEVLRSNRALRPAIRNPIDMTWFSDGVNTRLGVPKTSLHTAYQYLFWYWQLRMVKKSCQRIDVGSSTFLG